MCSGRAVAACLFLGGQPCCCYSTLPPAPAIACPQEKKEKRHKKERSTDREPSQQPPAEEHESKRPRREEVRGTGFCAVEQLARGGRCNDAAAHPSSCHLVTGPDRTALRPPHLPC